MFLRSSHTAPRIGLVLAPACWGLGAILSKAALAQLPPLTLLVVQLIASLAVLWPLLGWQHGAEPWNRRLLALGLLGLLNPGLSYTLSLIGLTLTTASLSALLWGLEPLLIVGLALLVLRERPTARFLALSGLALAGALLAIGLGVDQPGRLLGNSLILAGVVCCALYTVLAQRMGAGFSPLLTVTVQQSLALVGAVPTLLCGPAELSRLTLAGLQQIPPATWRSSVGWIVAALSGVIYYGLAFWFYLGGLQRVSAGEAGFFINLVPIFALGGAYVLLGERLTPAQWVGCGLVLLAVVGLSLSKNSSQASGSSVSASAERASTESSLLTK
jgi:drug/metabolite transporter (DMT)-like permease